MKNGVAYLGHIIFEKRVVVDKSKVENIFSWPTPTTVKALREFLDLSNYYRKFVKGYGVTAKPLTTLLQKDNFHWTDEATKAF